MTEHNLPPSPAELDLSFDPEQLIRFERDHPESPIVGFVPDDEDSVRLVIVEHNYVGHPQLVRADGTAQGAYITDNTGKLVFTPKEWVAFWAGVVGEKEGYEKAYEMPPDDMMRLRDSKNPDALFLFITFAGFCGLLDGMKAGKYNLPERQHTALFEELDAELTRYIIQQSAQQENI